ncbi:hypothetical protein [Streptacidiphilus jiangxiensis]|uniref:CU044_5270 family protein n=1 Tax=Streptacidiphilus jiangxiensis TaxID=235985 RepID=A0A1H7RLJ6_STRJI|nr:hypothetical protein [Streptacidiphilus jiangxiensis]SEL61190.1 hypothetical protein SAMN05414137_110204 [Streptacidiphilus jiangxiensis]
MNETTTEYLDFPGADTLQAAGRVAPPSAEVLDRARAAVLAAASAEQATSAVAPARPRRMVTGRRLAAVFALAAVAAGVVVATGGEQAPRANSLSATAQPPQPAVGATTFLDGVSEVAQAQSASTAPYWKVQLRSVVGGHTSTVTEYVSREGYVIRSKGRTYKKGAPSWAVGAKLVDWNGLDRLPTDPATLLAMMSAGQQGGRDVFGQAGNILGDSPASPALRAALFKALGRLSGVKLVGTVKDHAGRSGTELAFAGVNGSEALIVDPRTATVLEDVFWQAGGVSRTTYLESGPALSID